MEQKRFDCSGFHSIVLGMLALASDGLFRKQLVRTPNG